MEQKRGREMKTRRGVDFILSPVYLCLLLFERVLSAFLYGVKSIRDFKPPSTVRQMLSFLFIYLFVASLCFSVSSPIILSPELQ